MKILWTPEMLDKLPDLARKNTIKQLSQHYKIDEQTMIQKCNELKIKPKPMKLIKPKATLVNGTWTKKETKRGYDVRIA